MEIFKRKRIIYYPLTIFFLLLFFSVNVQAVPFSLLYSAQDSHPVYETARVNALNTALTYAYFDGWLGATNPAVSAKVCPMTNITWYQPNGAAGGYVVVVTVTCTKQIPG
ncbi:hypothetical protein JH274_17635 [Xanthomonas campestris pv. incanae]|uniref:hypothetical protein n=1 Tax=Xanthomonas campestris TaxID=339 RepID=UPI00236804E6|nr:hypothetical protein [Xanthomonas campestris]WDK25074.1 hypothetical protein JH274_17635 [Xanthomonas campestris pv. incanae]